MRFTATKKVTGRVLAADRAKHMAVIWIDPSLVSALPPAKLAYRDGAPALAEAQEIFSIDASLLDRKTLTPGRVGRRTVRSSKQTRSQSMQLNSAFSSGVENVRNDIQTRAFASAHIAAAREARQRGFQNHPQTVSDDRACHSAGKPWHESNGTERPHASDLARIVEVTDDPS